MSYTWNNPVYIAFSDWPLSLGNMHLKFLHVFSWLDRLIFFSHWIVSIVGFLGSSAGKEYTCNVGDTGSNPGSESSPGEGIGYPLLYSWASLVAQMVKESTCNAGDLGSIPGLGWAPGGGHGKPLQHSCLENPHGQRSLAGYSPWGSRESDLTEQLSTESIARYPLCGHTTVYSSIHLLKDIWVASEFWQLWIKLLCI